jgi:hypothetical protein
MVTVLPAVIMAQISPVFILNRRTHFPLTPLTYYLIYVRDSDFRPRG